MLLGKYLIYLPHSDGDALVIEHKAYLYSNSINLDYSSIFSQGHNFMAYLASFVYDIFGREQIVLGFLMAFLGTLLIKYVHEASLLIWNDPKLAKKVAWITVFFPQFCLHSALLLREIPVNICLLLAVISFIKFLNGSNVLYLVKFILFTALSMLFHSAMLFVFIGIIIFYIFRDQKKGGIVKKIVMPAFIVLVLFFINSKGIGLGKFGGSLDEGLNNFYIRESAKTLGGSAYPNWMRMSGSLSDLWKLPIRFITFLFSPLIPFLVKSPGHLLGAIDSFFYIYIFRLLYKNHKILKIKDEYRFIRSICLVLALIFSLGVTNVGTAIRHRAKFAPLLLIAMFEKRQLIKLVNKK